MVICWLTLEQSLLRRRRSIRFHFDYLGSLRLIARLLLFLYCAIHSAEILSSDRHRDNLTVWHCTDQSRLLSCKMISILCFFFSITILTYCARSLSSQNKKKYFSLSIVQITQFLIHFSPLFQARDQRTSKLEETRSREEEMNLRKIVSMNSSRGLMLPNFEAAAARCVLTIDLYFE